jgi:hypothetical protein
MKRSIRANAGAAPRQRVSTWHADLMPVVRELESRDASDAEVAAAVEKARQALSHTAPAAPTRRRGERTTRRSPTFWRALPIASATSSPFTPIWRLPT